MNYNVQYLTELSSDDNDSYEKHKVMRVIDKKISNVQDRALFHIVPIMYTIACFSGFCVFAYKIIF